MTRRRRILLSAGIVAACVAAVLGVLAMLPLRPGVTKANFDRIEQGMTYDEVDYIFSGNSSNAMKGFNGEGEFKWRADNGAFAHVGFVNGTVTFEKMWHPSKETIPDKFRRWLELVK